MNLYYSGATPAGQQLQLGFAVTSGQTGFDNVTMADQVPEVGGPAVFWTMLGVAGFWVYRKKRLVA